MLIVLFLNGSTMFIVKKFHPEVAIHVSELINSQLNLAILGIMPEVSNVPPLND